MSKSASNSPTPTPFSAVTPTLRPTTPTPATPNPTYINPSNPATTSTTSTFTSTTSPSLRPSSAQYRSEQQQHTYQPLTSSTASYSSRYSPYPPQSPPAITIASSSRLPPSRGPSSSPEYLIKQREVLMAKRSRDEPAEMQRRSTRARTDSTSSRSHGGSMADTEEHREGDSTSTSINALPEKKKRTRTLTTPHQSSVLHNLLAQSRFPTTAQREEVGRSIGLSARKVQIWFQNQRQKARRPVRSGAPPATPGHDPSLGNPGGDYQQVQYYRTQPPPPAGPYAYTGHYYEPPTYALQHHVPQAPGPLLYQHPQMDTTLPSLSGPGVHRDGGRGDFQSPYPYEESPRSPRGRPASRHRYLSPSPPRGAHLRDPGRTLAPISFQVRSSRPFAAGLRSPDHPTEERYWSSSPHSPRFSSPPAAAHPARSPSPQESGSAILRGQRYDPVRGVYVPIRRDQDPPTTT